MVEGTTKQQRLIMPSFVYSAIHEHTKHAQHSLGIKPLQLIVLRKNRPERMPAILPLRILRIYNPPTPISHSFTHKLNQPQPKPGLLGYIYTYTR